ncbi:hypothetical protein Ahy_B10g105640 [Arachis hypogaea]|uniref:Uncharacterized protein n=1 Tax=Arachis hypogaea TaxID=3818 RepID=A0A444X8F5_ARAHY|nr:hypothetical protein Ahy_B10g105640 [Arachis hypogaea]
MTTGRGLTDHAAGRGRSRSPGRGRVSFGTAENSRFSPSTLTTPVTSQVTDLADQPFIMVPALNYAPSSTATTPSPTAQQPVATATPPPATEAVSPESSHRIRELESARELSGWLPVSTVLYGMLSTILPSERYSTIEWVGGSNRYWRMFVRDGTT